MAGLAWENGVQATLGLGLVTGNGKNVKNQKWEWDLRIAKWDLEKNELENGIGTPFSFNHTPFISHKIRCIVT